ncbi:MAG: hypothetical protein IKX35_10715 [Bacteroidales bacterium]|nr:hypothetical protein [Bacteroidales bacterium]
MTTEGIGGYFELELPNCGGFLHDDGILLNSGRNALEYVLRTLGDVKHLFVPYYTCDAVLEPIEKMGVPCSFYHINKKLEIEDLPSLQRGDYLIYTNYFGVKDEYVKILANHYESHLIVDNAQAWFAEPIEGVNTIYSPRKFVGLPDGGIAYCTKQIDKNSFAQDVSFERCSHLLKRIDIGPSDGYADFRANSEQLKGQPIKQMSRLTQRMLSSVDFEVVKVRRKKNFEYLHKGLGKGNFFPIPSVDTFACPMVYPYLADDSSLKQKLIDNKVFVATYWPNVFERCKSEDWEYVFAECLAFIPIDQRYGVEDMYLITNIINKTERHEEDSSNWGK